MPRKRGLDYKQLPDGRWSVDVGLVANGQRGRTICNSEADAIAKVAAYKQAREEARRKGKSLTSMEKELAAEILEATQRMGFSLKEVLAILQDHFEQKSRIQPGLSPLFEDVAGRLLKKWEGPTYNPGYRRNRGGLVEAATSYFRGRNMGQIRLHEFRTWISQGVEQKETFKTRRAAISAVVTQAVDEEILQFNNIKSIKSPRHLIESETHYMEDIGMVAYVLDTAAKSGHDDIQISWVLQSFGGGRRDEISKKNKLKYEDIHLDDDPELCYVEYRKGVAAKKGPMRRCPLHPVAVEWLRPLIKGKTGFIVRPGYLKREAQLRKQMEAAIGSWGDNWSNVLRSNYGTYRLPMLDMNASLLGEEMGNTPKVINAYYNGRLPGQTISVKRKRAEPYWRLSPQECQKIAAEWLETKMSLREG